MKNQLNPNLSASDTSKAKELLDILNDRIDTLNELLSICDDPKSKKSCLNEIRSIKKERYYICQLSFDYSEGAECAMLGSSERSSESEAEADK